MSPADVKGKKPRVKKEKKTDGLKQTKLNFGKKETNGKGKGRKKKGEDSEDEILSGSASGSDIEFTKPSVQTIASTRAARNTKKKINYSFDSDDEKMSSGDEELFDNSCVKEEKNDKEIMTLSDSDEDKPQKRIEVSSEDLFDSLIGKKSDESFSEPQTNPPAEKRKRDNFVASDSESDKGFTNKKPKATGVFDSDDDFTAPKITSIDSDDDIDLKTETEISKPKTKRARAPPKKILDNNSDSDEDFGSTKPFGRKAMSSDEDFDFSKEKEKPSKKGRGKRTVKYNNSDDSD